jgi:2-succinyl-6-hydroxy-2,4-cyclohexadiene-1-carboxylate synthase
MGDFVQVNGVTYFVSVAGKGDPLLLLHGFTGSSAIWQAKTIFFSSHFRTITIDLLGHGRTDSPAEPSRYHMDQAAADIAKILDELEARPVHLLGYSMGGRLALYLSIHYPHRFKSLILESASPGLASPADRADRRRQDNSLADQIEQAGIKQFVNYWESLPLWKTHKDMPIQARQSLRQQRLQNNPCGLANSLRGMGSGIQPALWKHLGALTLPVLILAGAKDQKFVGIGNEMAARLPSAHLKIIPESGHMIHGDNSAVFNEAVLAFLRGGA